MKITHLIILFITGVAATSAQTPAKAATATTAKPAATATKSTLTSTANKLPPGVPVVHGVVKTAFALRYEDIKIGTGADAEPNKMYKVQYTGYRAADGAKFDSSYDHPVPVMGKDGKPEMNEDGKPKMGDPQPMSFPQGMGRLIPGFDQGFNGMKIGGKRRLFIPWQLAYGTRNIPDRPADHPGGTPHPGIPPKSDLIFDVELVDVTDLPMPPNHPSMGGVPGATPQHPGVPVTIGNPPPGKPPTPPTPAASGTPSTPAQSAPSAAPAAPAVPAPATPAPATPTTPAPPQPK